MCQTSEGWIKTAPWGEGQVASGAATISSSSSGLEVTDSNHII